jgi:hypothetical protein
MVFFLLRSWLKGDEHDKVSPGGICHPVRVNKGSSRSDCGDTARKRAGSGSAAVEQSADARKLQRSRAGSTAPHVPLAQGCAHLSVFALGPTHEPHEDAEWKSSQEQLDKELAKYPWLKPASIKLLGGKYDPALLRFPSI